MRLRTLLTMGEQGLYAPQDPPNLKGVYQGGRGVPTEVYPGGEVYPRWYTQERYIHPVHTLRYIHPVHTLRYERYLSPIYTLRYERYPSPYGTPYGTPWYVHS